MAELNMPLALPLPVPLRHRVATIVARDGERAALARLKIGRQTIARAIAGLPISTGTHALLRQQLDFLDAENARLDFADKERK